MGTSDTLHTFKHTDSELSSYIDNLPDSVEGEGSYLTLLAGENRAAKKQFYQKIKKTFGNELTEVDLRDVVTTELKETSEHIDRLFKNISSAKAVWFRNGDQLGGVYTGFSYSVRRYATPHERYLLEKIGESRLHVFLDLEDIHTVNNMMRRHAQTLITFEQPATFLGKLKQITVHGSSFASNRKAVKK